MLKLDANLELHEIQHKFEKYFNCKTNQATIDKYIRLINQMK